MAEPVRYDKDYNFSGFQSSNPTTPLPADALDDELFNIEASISDIVTAIGDIRRSDGGLVNGIVTADSLSDGLQSLLGTGGVDYATLVDMLSGGPMGYVLRKASSADFDFDWVALTGGGDMLSVNNLSDLANADTALDNLGLTSIGKNIATAATAAAVRTLLSLTVGTNVQAYSSVLGILSGFTPAADKGLQFTGPSTVGTFDLTTAGKALLDDANAAAQRATLGLGNAATLALANQAEAEAGASATTLMTPERVAQAIAAQVDTAPDTSGLTHVASSPYTTTGVPSITVDLSAAGGNDLVIDFSAVSPSVGSRCLAIKPTYTAGATSATIVSSCMNMGGTVTMFGTVSAGTLTGRVSLTPAGNSVVDLAAADTCTGHIVVRNYRTNTAVKDFIGYIQSSALSTDPDVQFISGRIINSNPILGLLLEWSNTATEAAQAATNFDGSPTINIRTRL